MKLVYVIYSRHTTANSNYKLHLPASAVDPNFTDLPFCFSHTRCHSYEITEGEKPTCKKCLKEWDNWGKER